MDWYRKRPLFWWGLLFSLGIVIARIFGDWFVFCGTSVVVSGFVLINLIHQRDRFYHAIILCAILLLGGLRFIGTQTKPNSLLQPLVQSQNSLVFQGVITNTDSTRSGKQFYETVPLKIYSRSIKAQEVQVWVPEVHPVISPGDTIECIGVVQQFPRARNPGEFDYRKYQQLKKRYFQLSVRYPWELQVQKGKLGLFRRTIRRIQTKINSLIYETFDHGPAAFASALILGRRDEINQDVIQTYSSLGIIHVLAVSGLHVGYVTLILLALFSLLPVNYRTIVILTVMGLALYAALVEFRPSVVRASIMASVLLLAQASEQRYDILNLLGVAALVILVVNPLQLFQIGFQLSFMAVLGIVLFYNRIESALETTGFSIANLSKPAQYMLGLLLVSIAAFLTTAPLTAYYFRMVPVWGLVLNLLVIPLIGIIVISTFVVILTGLFWPGLSGLYAEVPNSLIHLMNKILQWLYHSGFHAVQLPGISPGYILFLYLLLLLFLFIKRKNLLRYAFFGILLLANILIWKPKANHNLRVTFLDVGQGDAAVIESPHGKTLLVDAGIRTFQSDRGADVIIPFLRYRGISHIDVAEISHPHNDHIGGYPAILRNYEVDEIWDSKHSYGTKIMKEVHTLADSQGSRYHLIAAGFDTTIDQVFFRTYFPVSQEIDDNLNNHSIVQKIQYGQTSLLLPGDIEAKVEPLIDLYGTDIQSQLLKVPHHGSITSSTPDFIHTVAPNFAIISVGAHNKFGHPSLIVLKRYQKYGSTPLLTMQEGALIFESDGSRWKRISWR